MAQFVDRLGRERRGSAGNLEELARRKGSIEELFKRKRDKMEKEEGAGGEGDEDFSKRSNKTVRTPPGGEDLDVKGLLRGIREEMREGLRGVKEEIREVAKGKRRQ